MARGALLLGQVFAEGGEPQTGFFKKTSVPIPHPVAMHRHIPASLCTHKHKTLPTCREYFSAGMRQALAQRKRSFAQCQDVGGKYAVSAQAYRAMVKTRAGHCGSAPPKNMCQSHQECQQMPRVPIGPPAKDAGHSTCHWPLHPCHWAVAGAEATYGFARDDLLSSCSAMQFYVGVQGFVAKWHMVPEASVAVCHHPGALRTVPSHNMAEATDCYLQSRLA